jgi:hypothetical protein
VSHDQNHGTVDNGEESLAGAEGEKTKQNGIFATGMGLKWTASSRPASTDYSPVRFDRLRNDQSADA